MRTKMLLLGLAVRLAVVLYAMWHDGHMPVKYTDIDYEVFTDAARFVENGGSPYERQTYRYPPVLAWVLLPCGSVKIFGKILFSVVDVLIGYVMCKAGASERASLLLWIFNPIVINVSTRGNADSLVLLPLLAALYCLQSRGFFASGTLLGVAVHLRLFPVIYLPCIGLYLLIVDETLRGKLSAVLRFGLGFVAALAGLTFVSYRLYGDEYLENAYLYHYGRVDHRHNLSAYFLPAYLGVGVHGGFFPQLLSVLAVSFRFFRYPGYTMLLVTMLFVTLNKVVTVQYFTWYFSLLPVAAPYFSLSSRTVLAIVLTWLLSLILWLGTAYHLEFKGFPLYTPLWSCSLLFLAANTFAVFSVIRGFTGKLKQG